MCSYTTRGLRYLHAHGGSVLPEVAGESLGRSAETIPALVPCDDDGMFSRASLKEGWMRDETGSYYAVKGDVDACELRPRRGFPDKTDAATNRRWVTADTPPIFDWI